MKTRVAIPLIAAACLAANSAAPAPLGYFEFKEGATFETGDTWLSAGKRYRLYGLQSCLRGTLFTDRSGTKRDCGEASIAMLAAYVKDTHPLCAPVVAKGDLTYVACYATVGRQQLDLAMIIMTEGYGFASLNSKGLPVYPAYAVAEQKARQEKQGLWQFNDVQHPALLLSRAVHGLKE